MHSGINLDLFRE
uniref:Uncharacterized protein n=1 Tax=Lotus japonicus TaxID=34305 RepID=I3T2C2_LOTJA|nr:unknown [Lotus japonicus]